MTKKWRLKVDTPWGEKGSIFRESMPNWWTSGHRMRMGVDNGFDLNPAMFPHLFEPVKEKSDVERVVDWLLKNKLPVLGHIEPLTYILAEKLLAAGVSVDKLEGK